MKKLLLLFLAVAGMVSTVSATETIWLRTNVGSWNDNLDAWKIEGLWNAINQQDEYEFDLPASKIGDGDFYFRLFRNNTDFQLGPYNHVDYPYAFADGMSETYTATANNDFKGENGAFLIEHSKIKASKYKISIYIKYPENADWIFYIKVDIVSMPLTITDASGYATFSCDRALDFSSVAGLTAYVAAAPDNGRVSMVSVSNPVPANTGLFIKGTAATIPYEIPVVMTSAASSWNQTNYLHPTDGNSVGADNYVFAKQGTDVGFYKLGSDTQIEKGKAYLSSTAATTAARLTISFNDASSISSVKSANVENSYFDLQGRRVAQPTKGLYIVNGKKVIK